MTKLTKLTLKIIPQALLDLKATFEEDKQRGRDATSKASLPRKERALEKDKAIEATATKIKAKTKNENGKTKPDTKEAKEKVAPIGPVHIPLRNNVRVQDALDWLYTIFPKVFHPQNRVPLKLGIVNDIFAFVEKKNKRNEQEMGPQESIHTIIETDGEVLIEPVISVSERDANTHNVHGGSENPTPSILPTKRALRQAVSFYVSSSRYVKALTTEAMRFDLDGKEAGAVLEEHKAHALKTYDHQMKRIQRRKRKYDDKRKKEDGTVITPLE